MVTFDPFLRIVCSEGRWLGDLGLCQSYGYTKPVAFRALDALKGTGVIMIGSEVMSLVGSKWQHTVNVGKDVWYFSSPPGETPAESSLRSIAELRNFVSAHRNPEGGEVLFTLELSCGSRED